MRPDLSSATISVIGDSGEAFMVGGAGRGGGDDDDGGGGARAARTGA